MFSMLTISNMAGLMTIIVGIITIKNLIINDDVISKIRKMYYVIYSEEYIILSHNAYISMLFPIIMFYLWLIIYKIGYSKNLIMVEIYLIIGISLLIFDHLMLMKKIKTLHIICDSISCDTKIMTKRSVNSKFSYIVFSVYCILYPIITWLNVYELYKISISIIFVLIYILYIATNNIKCAKYKHEAYIEPVTILRVNFKRYYKCICNLKLKKNYVIKNDKNYVRIFYPGEVTSYLIPHSLVYNQVTGYKLVVRD